MSEEIVKKETTFTEEQLDQHKNNSVTSFILSMIGLAFFPTIVGLLVLGIMSLIRANKVPSAFQKAPYRSLCNVGRGFAIFEIILSIASVAIGIIVFIVYLIMLAIAAATVGAASTY